jgi:large subunit ribosomal protein L25
MNKFEINAEPRADKGKGASRRLRRTGKVPGILYGAGQDPAPIALDHDDISHHLEHEAFYSHILTLNIGGEKQKVVLKDLQRHPFKPRIQHMDLQRVSETEKLTMRIPIHFINEDKCIGIKQGGGVASHIMTELEVRCLPADLPEYIEIDLAEIDLGHTIHLGDLKLPDRVESYTLAHGGDPSSPVVSVHMPKLVVEEVSVAEAAAAEAAAAEGAAVAAAAGAEPAAAAGKEVKEGKETKETKESKEAKGGKGGKGEGKGKS